VSRDFDPIEKKKPRGEQGSRRELSGSVTLVWRLANNLSIESVDAPRQQGAQVKAYRESTANLRNEAGADAAALECQGICETPH
jgi:hypothetical protein